MLEVHPRRSQCGMSAQIDLFEGGKPADAQTTFFIHEEGGLGEIILHRDLLHQRIGQPAFQWADCRWIAAKQVIAKGVELIDL